MNQATLNFSVSSNDYNIPLRIQCRFDGQTIFDQVIDQPCRIEHQFADNSDPHVLEIELKDKQMDHTVIDDQGQIISDSLIDITNIEIEGIAIDQLFYQKSQYQHDFNGTQTLQTVNFYGTLGCNGTVRLQFESPVYLWLLENL